MVKKLAPVGQGAGTFQGVEAQSATLLTATSSARRRPAMSDEQRAEIVDQYVEQGRTVRQIASQVGRSYGTVHRVLREQHVTMRGRNGR